MSRWLEPVRSQLAARESRLRWFFRDDDAGWDDRRLLALVDVLRRGGAHVDLAAIPSEISLELGRRLVRLVAGGDVAVHQHGWAHANHEPRGRKCEFGPARDRTAQRCDLAQGRRVLAERLEGRAEPFFTPPWNRCTGTTAELLAELGFSVLSTRRTAPRHHVPGLAEIPVAVDWTRAWSKGGRDAVAQELRRTLLLQPAGAFPPALGVMLHHAVMSKDELAALSDLLALLDEAPTVDATSIGGCSMREPSRWSHRSVMGTRQAEPTHDREGATRRTAPARSPLLPTDGRRP